MYKREQWKDPRWQKKRLEIMERDGWKCVSCGDSEEMLSVHHVSYSGSEDWEGPWDCPDLWDRWATLEGGCKAHQDDWGPFI